MSRPSCSAAVGSVSGDSGGCSALGLRLGGSVLALVLGFLAVRCCFYWFAALLLIGLLAEVAHGALFCVNIEGILCP